MKDHGNEFVAGKLSFLKEINVMKEAWASS